jgi:predicted GNAT family N-acyltransferase
MNSPGKPLLEFARIEHNSNRYRDLVALRRRVLRAPLGLDFTPEQLAKERDDIHIGAYLHERLVACVSLTATDKSHGSPVRLRQMAVDPDHQGRGVGKRLIAYAERLSAEMGYREIVLNARETAASFYESVGYVAEGDAFTEVTIPHLRMVKPLAARG